MELAHRLGGIGFYACESHQALHTSKVAEKASSLFTGGTLTGFDASGHIAEETKNARHVMS